ncbi:replication factor A protein, partial [Trifolium medium]|nr:replication factor A protein [Trifolium medium]
MFKSSCCVNRIALHGVDLDAPVPLIGGSAKPSLDEEFLRMYPKKKIGELVDLAEDGIFVVCGVVAGIVGGEEWWYPAWKCHKAVVPDSGAYYCNSCVKHIFQVIPRFKVKIEVSDGDSTVGFVLFDSDMSYLMEKSYAFFVSQSK